MVAWQLGNTSVRSAMRIRDGLIAYSQSDIQGDIRKREGDEAFRNLLGRCGVVSLGTDETQSVGRKWRSAMGKLGFIYPKVSQADGISQSDLGPLDFITPAGWNLIRADTVPAMQECFLRALIVPLQSAQDGDQLFSPLIWTLSLLLEIDRMGCEEGISFLEMASIVQLSDPCEGVENVVGRIVSLRRERDGSRAKKKFDKEYLDLTASKVGCMSGTLRDYADMNIRYLKATGMVRAKGRGVMLVPEKCSIAIQLTGVLLANVSRKDMLTSLCRGADLPTDDDKVAVAVLRSMVEQAHDHGIVFDIQASDLRNSSSANRARFRLEALLSEAREEEYARNQVDEWDEIATYLNALAANGEAKCLNGERVFISREERPAYLEWSMWRAILAIDSLANKPYQVIRFKVDQDFLPVGTAPGNGPDLVAEFDDFIIAIEVTLSGGSRQEAMEGEPVRRHVADLCQRYEKSVYGIFIAGKVDTNTAETFRRGIWYLPNDERLDLHIVPLTIEQFAKFFRWLFEHDSVSPQMLVDLVEKCSEERDGMDAPLWKKSIGTRLSECMPTL